MQSLNTSEKLHDYELLSLFGGSVRLCKEPYRLTEDEAQQKNQAFALNNVSRRFVRIQPRLPSKQV